MRRLLLALPASAALVAATASYGTGPVSAPLSGDWALETAQSRLSFVTIKAGQIVEAHRFETLSGAVAADGKATFAIDLASVNTGIEVRDQRMRDFLFQIPQFPKATVTTQIDPTAVSGLEIGEQLILPVEASVNLHGLDAPVEAELAVTRIAADKVKVETTAPIIVDADSFALGDGIAKLQELAKLPSITNEVPVSFSLVFEHTAP